MEFLVKDLAACIKLANQEIASRADREEMAFLNRKLKDENEAKSCSK